MGWFEGNFADLMMYGATMMLGGLPAVAFFAQQTWHNLSDSSPTHSILSLPVLLPLALFGLWYVIEAGFRRGTVGPNRFGADPVRG